MNEGAREIDGQRLEALRQAAGEGPVLILTHDNPDPDSLASGKALSVLLRQVWGIESELLYTGLVTRAENQNVLKLLTPEWRQVEALEQFERYSSIALVDTQPNAGNNSLPGEVTPSIVIDHHLPYQPALDKVQFVDVRQDVGATICLVVQYLEAAEVEPDRLLATAIFYGIQTDTRSLTRSESAADRRIYFNMLGRIDRDLLMQVEQAGLPREYFKAFVGGLQAARVAGRVVVSYLGPMHRPDFAAELADLLVRLKETQAVLCSGYHDATMYISLRASNPELDAGRLIQEIIVPQGQAGGHGTVAGGRVPLEGLKPDDVAFEIERRFLNAMGENPHNMERLL